MGKRGPKPTDIRDLRIIATQWAIFLFALRDGQDGAIYKRKALVARVLPVKKARTLPAELRKQKWRIRAPLPPESHGWNQLQHARSLRHIQQAIQKIIRWERRLNTELFPGEHIGYFPSISEFVRRLRFHASGFLMAKRLPSYPNSDRLKSRDKRIQFFAKVLAGLDMGIRPAYAVKLLSGWRFPKHHIEQNWKAFTVDVYSKGTRT